MIEKDLQDLRTNYSKKELNEKDAGDDPFSFFKKWMQEAIDSQVIEATAMTLATSSLQGIPNTRIMLLKGLEDNQFKFYSNYSSNKGQDLEENPNASLLFFWAELERQVRVDGIVSKLSREESLEYFHTRPRESQIGAHTSQQSSIIQSRNEIEVRFNQLTKDFESLDRIPIPDNWGGYSLQPNTIEFWQGRPSRLHDRIRFRKLNDTWIKERLSP